MQDLHVGQGEEASSGGQDGIDSGNSYGGVTYRLATKPVHFRFARELLRAHGDDCNTLSYPTVLAYEEDRLVGFISTHKDRKDIIAGPIFVPERRPLVAFRLLELYEAFLRTASAPGYKFAVMKDNAPMLALVKKLGVFEAFHETEAYTLFWRPLNGNS